MIKIARHVLIKYTYILIDIMFVSLCIYISCLFRASTLPFEVTYLNCFFDPTNPFRFVFLFWILVAIIINNSNDLYQTRREIVETVEVWRVIKTVFFSSLMTIVAIYVVKIEDFPRSVLFLTAFFMASSFSLWRICKRFFVDFLVSQGYNNFNAIIIGAGKVGQTLRKEIEAKPSLGINVVGFLDDFKADEDLKDGRILGCISDFVKIAQTEFIDKVFITIHHDSNVFMNILQQAKAKGVAVRVVPQGFELMPGEFNKYNIGFVPILEYCNVVNKRKQVGKRFFDFVVATFLLIILSPCLLFVALLIKLDSPGPIFYISKRFGRSGRVFPMFKFRSMVMDADTKIKGLMEKNEVDGPIFKIKKDPRVTSFGKFLRKFSFDELPQILNVVLGHMSLVGPRPLPINQVQKEDYRQLRRLEIRPGITGLWQIRGRSDLSFARLVRWDMWYINNWSFWLDLNILLQTIPTVMKGKGAY